MTMKDQKPTETASSFNLDSSENGIDSLFNVAVRLNNKASNSIGVSMNSGASTTFTSGDFVGKLMYVVLL